MGFRLRDGFGFGNLLDAAIAVCCRQIVRPMAFQRKERLVKLPADDGKEQKTVNRDTALQYQEQPRSEHNPKGYIY